MPSHCEAQTDCTTGWQSHGGATASHGLQGSTGAQVLHGSQGHGAAAPVSHPQSSLGTGVHGQTAVEGVTSA